MIYDTNDEDTLARTLYGEARGEPDQGQIAVAWVIRNRAQNPRFAGDLLGKPGAIARVCLARWQFSCWNENDPNRAKIEGLNVALIPRQWTIADNVLTGRAADITGGADHYHTIAAPGWADKWPPGWAQAYSETARFGGHVFYDSRRPRRDVA
jgi:hypothetical protein